MFCFMLMSVCFVSFFFSSRRRHTRLTCDWSSDVCSSDLTARGAERWTRGHPWIFRSEVQDEAAEAPGIVRVHDAHGRFIGQALYSPASEIRLRLVERTDRAVDAGWWREKLAACRDRRVGIDATACRIVHGEGDGL